MLSNSPVQRFRLCGRDWWLKRDDLLQPFGGNKARKLWHYAQHWPAPARIVSYGGAQSNAMLALARFAQLKGCEFMYYTRPLPRWLRAQPTGNLQAALDCKMQLIELVALERAAMRWADADDSLFIPQGIACAAAEPGLAQLAAEIHAWAAQQGLAQLAVCLPSGTGSSAFYLQQHLQFPVYTLPCVGDTEYLRTQFACYHPDPATWPRILTPTHSSAFAQPQADYWKIWQALGQASGVEFELLYDPPTWLSIIQQHWDAPVLYVHCGGQEGNASMLARYRRAGFTYNSANDEFSGERLCAELLEQSQNETWYLS